VRNVEFHANLDPPEVHYTDLLLDLWVDASGVRWEDDDELADALRAGTLTPSDVVRIEGARELISRRHRAIASEVRALLARLGKAM
jgi:predicted RNA-binding protein associated with RNAse of E/G family